MTSSDHEKQPPAGGTPGLWARAKPMVSAALLLGGSLASVAFDHEHTRWGHVLAAHVRQGAVDYAGLKARPAELDLYLDELAAVREAEFKAWTEPQQLAFLFNLYNAATLRLVLDHYPVSSIRKIGGVFSGPWQQAFVRLWGKRVTLDELEHKIIRKRYREPRAHFALVCAARGCPVLPTEPYVAERLASQLDDQGRMFLAQAGKNRVDTTNQVLHLSPIFRWYTEDFTAGNREVTDFVAPYLKGVSAGELRGYRIEYTEYDWGLNDQGAAP